MYVAQYIDVTMLELLLTRRLCCHTSMQYFCSFFFVVKLFTKLASTILSQTPRVVFIDGNNRKIFFIFNSKRI